MFEEKPTPAGSGHAGAGYSYPGDLAQFVRDRWRNVPEPPGGVDPNDVAVEQVRDLLGRLPHRSATLVFVFDAGYDPVKLQRGLESSRAHVLVRLHSNRTFYAAPEEVEPRPLGRPRLLAAYAQLRLARPCVADRYLPWERPQRHRGLTPWRTLRSFAALLVAVGTPAGAPKPCGRSPGRPKGRLSGRAKRYPAIKKAA